MNAGMVWEDRGNTTSIEKDDTEGKLNSCPFVFYVLLRTVLLVWFSTCMFYSIYAFL